MSGARPLSGQAGAHRPHGGVSDQVRQLALHGAVGEARYVPGAAPTIRKACGYHFVPGTFRTRSVDGGMLVTKLDVQE